MKGLACSFTHIIRLCPSMELSRIQAVLYTLDALHLGYCNKVAHTLLVTISVTKHCEQTQWYYHYITPFHSEGSQSTDMSINILRLISNYQNCTIFYVLLKTLELEL